MAFEQPLFRYAQHLGAHQRLRLACRHGDMHEFHQSLRQGANPNDVSEEGSSAWQAALEGQNLEALNLLLERFPSPEFLANPQHSEGWPDLQEVLATHGIIDPTPFPDQAWTMAAIDTAVGALESTRERFGLQPGFEAHWGVARFLGNVSVWSSTGLTQPAISNRLLPNDPLRGTLGPLVMGSGGVVLFTSEHQAPQLLLSPAMARHLAPLLAEPTAPARTKPRLH